MIKVNEELQVLVIGRGSVGQRHYNNVKALGYSCQLVSWRELHEDGLRYLLNQCPNIRAVFVCTATNIRMEILRLCHSANIPFYCEKPLVYRPQDLEEIYGWEPDYLARCAVGYMMRYHPAVQFLKCDVDLTSFQMPLVVSLNAGSDVSRWRNNWEFSKSYAAASAGGGVLLDLSHEIDLAIFLFGSLYLGNVRSYEHHALSNVDIKSMIDLYRRDVFVDVNVDYLAYPPVRTITIQCPDKRMIIDLVAEKSKISVADEEGERIVVLLPKHERNNMFMDITKDFFTNLKQLIISEKFPSLKHVRETNEAVCEAYQKRKFIAKIEVWF